MPTLKMKVDVNTNAAERGVGYQRNAVVRAVLGVVHHVLCKANCRGVKDVEATRGALPVT